MKKIYKMAKVGGYIAASGALVALVDWVSAMDLSESGVAAVVTVGAVNIILKGLMDWIRTKK